MRQRCNDFPYWPATEEGNRCGGSGEGAALTGAGGSAHAWECSAEHGAERETDT